jgi:hypothetical protein
MDTLGELPGNQWFTFHPNQALVDGVILCVECPRQALAFIDHPQNEWRRVTPCQCGSGEDDAPRSTARKVIPTVFMDAMDRVEDDEPVPR